MTLVEALDSEVESLDRVITSLRLVEEQSTIATEQIAGIPLDPETATILAALRIPFTSFGAPGQRPIRRSPVSTLRAAPGQRPPLFSVIVSRTSAPGQRVPQWR